jgi:putative nucleotidyltransferase with HDIG domain
MLKQGMIAAEDVYHSSGMLIIADQTQITDRIIQLLRQYDVLSIRVMAPKEIDNAPIIYSTYSNKIKTSDNFLAFEKSVNQKAEELSTIFSDIIEKSLEIDPNILVNDVKAIFTGIKTTGEIFDYLNIMRTSDDVKYAHCINVAILCNVFGRWLNMPESEVEVLVLAGLLHDIGKVKVPKEILEKSESLNEEEFENIKKHSIYGYRILEKQKNLDPRIKMVALLHHERCDGKGYPQRRKYDDIDYFTKLVAIADVYEAMTSSRKYRNKICPFEVVEMFEREGFQKFDPDLVISLLERIAQTQLNNVVKLSSGETGEIVFINRLSLARPILKVNDALIDLTDWPDLKIIEVL